MSVYSAFRPRTADTSDSEGEEQESGHPLLAQNHTASMQPDLDNLYPPQGQRQGDPVAEAEQAEEGVRDATMQLLPVLFANPPNIPTNMKSSELKQRHYMLSISPFDIDDYLVTDGPTSHPDTSSQVIANLEQLKAHIEQLAGIFATEVDAFEKVVLNIGWTRPEEGQLLAAVNLGSDTEGLLSLILKKEADRTPASAGVSEWKYHNLLPFGAAPGDWKSNVVAALGRPPMPRHLSPTPAASNGERDRSISTTSIGTSKTYASYNTADEGEEQREDPAEDQEKSAKEMYTNADDFWGGWDDDEGESADKEKTTEAKEEVNSEDDDDYWNSYDARDPHEEWQKREEMEMEHQRQLELETVSQMGSVHFDNMEQRFNNDFTAFHGGPDRPGYGISGGRSFGATSANTAPIAEDGHEDNGQQDQEVSVPSSQPRQHSMNGDDSSGHTYPDFPGVKSNHDRTQTNKPSASLQATAPSTAPPGSPRSDITDLGAAREVEPVTLDSTTVDGTDRNSGGSPREAEGEGYVFAKAPADEPDAKNEDGDREEPEESRITETNTTAGDTSTHRDTLLSSSAATGNHQEESTEDEEGGDNEDARLGLNREAQGGEDMSRNAVDAADETLKQPEQEEEPPVSPSATEEAPTSQPATPGHEDAAPRQQRRSGPKDDQLFFPPPPMSVSGQTTYETPADMSLAELEAFYRDKDHERMRETRDRIARLSQTNLRGAAGRDRDRASGTTNHEDSDDDSDYVSAMNEARSALGDVVPDYTGLPGLEDIKDPSESAPGPPPKRRQPSTQIAAADVPVPGSPARPPRRPVPPAPSSTSSSLRSESESTRRTSSAAQRSQTQSIPKAPPSAASASGARSDADPVEALAQADPTLGYSTDAPYRANELKEDKTRERVPLTRQVSMGTLRKLADANRLAGPGIPASKGREGVQGRPDSQEEESRETDLSELTSSTGRSKAGGFKNFLQLAPSTVVTDMTDLEQPPDDGENIIDENNTLSREEPIEEKPGEEDEEDDDDDEGQSERGSASGTAGEREDEDQSQYPDAEEEPHFEQVPPSDTGAELGSGLKQLEDSAQASQAGGGYAESHAEGEIDSGIRDVEHGFEQEANAHDPGLDGGDDPAGLPPPLPEDIDSRDYVTHGEDAQPSEERSHEQNREAQQAMTDSEKGYGVDLPLPTPATESGPPPVSGTPAAATKSDDQFDMEAFMFPLQNKKKGQHLDSPDLSDNDPLAREAFSVITGQSRSNARGTGTGARGEESTTPSESFVPGASSDASMRRLLGSMVDRSRSDQTEEVSGLASHIEDVEAEREGDREQRGQDGDQREGAEEDEDEGEAGKDRQERPSAPCRGPTQERVRAAPQANGPGTPGESSENVGLDAAVNSTSTELGLPEIDDALSTQTQSQSKVSVAPGPQWKGAAPPPGSTSQHTANLRHQYLRSQRQQALQTQRNRIMAQRAQTQGRLFTRDKPEDGHILNLDKARDDDEDGAGAGAEEDEDEDVVPAPLARGAAQRPPFPAKMSRQSTVRPKRDERRGSPGKAVFVARNPSDDEDDGDGDDDDQADGVASDLEDNGSAHSDEGEEEGEGEGEGEDHAQNEDEQRMEDEEDRPEEAQEGEAEADVGAELDPESYAADQLRAEKDDEENAQREDDAQEQEQQPQVEQEQERDESEQPEDADGEQDNPEDDEQDRHPEDTAETGNRPRNLRNQTVSDMGMAAGLGGLAELANGEGEDGGKHTSRSHTGEAMTPPLEFEERTNPAAASSPAPSSPAAPFPPPNGILGSSFGPDSAPSTPAVERPNPMGMGQRERDVRRSNPAPTSNDAHAAFNRRQQEARFQASTAAARRREVLRSLQRRNEHARTLLKSFLHILNDTSESGPSGSGGDALAPAMGESEFLRLARDAYREVQRENEERIANGAGGRDPTNAPATSGAKRRAERERQRAVEQGGAAQPPLRKGPARPGLGSAGRRRTFERKPSLLGGRRDVSSASVAREFGDDEEVEELADEGGNVPQVQVNGNGDGGDFDYEE